MADDATTPQSIPEVAAPLGKSGLIQFCRECVAELRRVQWPNRQQLWQATAVVLILTTIVGAYIYGLDQIFRRVAEWLIGKQAA